MIGRDPTRGPGDDPDQNNLLLVVMLSVGFIMMCRCREQNDHVDITLIHRYTLNQSELVIH